MNNKTILSFLILAFILSIFTYVNFIYLPKSNVINNVETLLEVKKFHPNKAG